MTNIVADAELTKFIKDLVEPLMHCKQLGLTVIAAEKGKLLMALPYSKHIVGNPDTGIIHGGALTTLLDTASGFSAIASLETFEIAPTLDLRIDYMRPATKDKTVLAHAEAYRITPHVIFASAFAFHEEDEDRPIARCTASFMRMKGALGGGKHG
ncbi:MAG: PaaI family thioesterase [Cellvibrionales bacterium]|nr:PaaI family thioesterase [Cellvibrionales bacterium]